ncbi:MAG: hypothetical protein ACKO37_08725 [Vampirovibrionales bacterium]
MSIRFPSKRVPNLNTLKKALSCPQRRSAILGSVGGIVVPLAIAGGSLWFFQQKRKEEEKQWYTQLKNDYAQYKEPFPKALNIKLTDRPDELAYVDASDKNVIYINPKKWSTEAKTSLDRLGIMKHEERHLAIDQELRRRGFTAEAIKALYQKTQCQEEVDAERARYHTLTKHDPAFAKKTPYLIQMESAYSKECQSTFEIEHINNSRFGRSDRKLDSPKDFVDKLLKP